MSNDKFLTDFSSLTEYRTFTNSSTDFVRPNVSYVENDNHVFYNAYEEPSEIVLSLNGKYYSVSQSDYNQHYNEISASGYTEEGIVVVPSAHTDDGTTRIVSLKSMSYSSPESGSSSNITIPWGGVKYTRTCGATDTAWSYQYKDGLNIPELINRTTVPIVSNAYGETTVGSLSYGYLPLDTKQTTGVQSIFDSQAFYEKDTTTIYSNNYIPSPFLIKNVRNKLYRMGASTNALSDFDGKGNTEKIIAYATAQTDWQTAASLQFPTWTNIQPSGSSVAAQEIDLLGYYPAACSCYRYKTSGINDWYLPACGELGYMAVRRKSINAAINLINNKKVNSGVVTIPASWFWSSSEFYASNARCVNTSNGSVHSSNKFYGYYVRAFASVVVLPLGF